MCSGLHDRVGKKKVLKVGGGSYRLHFHQNLNWNLNCFISFGYKRDGRDEVVTLKGLENKINTDFHLISTGKIF